MIRYSLKCAAEHGFESWFQSSAAFDSLSASGHVACPVCGSTEVAKSLMAPAVRPGGASAAAPDPAGPQGIEEALAALRRKIEETSDYVGDDFAAEARRIHAGEAPERSIYGNARLDEARRMIEEGLPVAPLPFLPRRRMN